MENNEYKKIMLDAAKEIQSLRARLNTKTSDKLQSIAICGMSCRLPGRANTPQQFYKNIRDGIDGISEVPESRWDYRRYQVLNRYGLPKIYTPYGGFIEDIEKFDLAFFGIPPKEAKCMDPQHRILLEATWHALESARINPDTLRNQDVGVFVAINTFDYVLRMSREQGEDDINAYFGTGNALAAASGRISYYFGFRGPSISMDTACSSSLVALHEACRSLKSGEISTAVVGGVNLMLSPELTINFCQAGMLAKDGRCKSFDARADGYIRGEGCGVLILKRLDDAEREKLPVLAVIKGSAINQDGSSSGFTVPNGRAQIEVIQKALADANIEPSAVDYVEAHGTGTALGDPIEINAINNVYGQWRKTADPLFVGTVKSNIGHLEAAAGIAGVIKSVLCLHYQKVLPNINFEQPNPNIDWQNMAIMIPTAAMNKKLNNIAVSSFGFTGSNAHLILGAYINKGPKKVERIDGYTLAITAKTKEAIDCLVDRCISYLQKGHSATALCETLLHGRKIFDHRIKFSANDPKKLMNELLAFKHAAPADKREQINRYSAQESIGDFSSTFISSSSNTHNCITSNCGPFYPFTPSHVWYRSSGAAPIHTIHSTSNPDTQAMVGYYKELSSAAPLVADEDDNYLDYLRFTPLVNPIPGFSWINAFQKSLITDHDIQLIKKAQRQMKDVLYKGISFDRIRQLADIGCGYGSDLIELASLHPNISLHGFNISLDQLQVAQKNIKTKRLDSNIRLFHRNSAEDNWGAKFQMVISYQVIHHIQNKRSIFRQISKFLEEGGLFVCAEILSNHSEPVHHEFSTAYFETIAFWAKELAANHLIIREVVDASREIANYLYDPDFYNHFKKIQNLLSSESTHHLEGPHLLGELLRREVTRYFLFSIQKTTLISVQEIESINQRWLCYPTSYIDAVSSIDGSKRKVQEKAPPTITPQLEASLDVSANSDISQSELKAYITSLLHEVAEIEPDAVNFDSPISDFGLDSIMALDMKQKIEKGFSIEIPMTSMLEDVTLMEFADNLHNKIMLKSYQKMTNDDFSAAQLAARLDEMCDDEVDQLYQKLTTKG